MTQTASPSPKTMLAYRDELVRALRRSSDLLDQAEKTESIKHEEKGAPRILTTEDLPKLREIIAEEIQKLNHFDVVLSVVGIMKAGKSTTINAIVGQEIMPNRNQAMTTLPTLIYHTPEQVTPKLSFVEKPANTFVQGLKTAFKENKKLFDYVSRAVEKSDELRKIVQDIQNNRCRFKAEYSGSSEIFDFLEQLNDLVRLAGLLSNFPDDSIIVQFPFDDYQKISQLPKIEVEFASLKNADPTEGRLVLLDTPGPNEAGQKHLKDMLDEQLQHSSAVLLIMDYTQLNSDASESVKNLVENLPTLDEDRLFVLANKFDEKDANSQDEAELKQYIKCSLPPGKVRDENIFPVSAKNAFLASRMLTELKNGKPEYDKGSWVGDFAKQAFGVMNPGRWEKVMREDITETANILIEESLIQQPIDQAIANTQKHAPRIAMLSALAQCKKVLDTLHNFSDIWTKTLEKSVDDIKRLKEEIQQCQQSAQNLDELRPKLERDIKTLQQDVLKKIGQLPSDLKEDLGTYTQSFRSGITNDLQQKMETNKQEMKDKKLSGFRLLSGKDEKRRIELNTQLEEVKKQLAEVKEKDGSIPFSNEQDAKEFADSLAKKFGEFVKILLDQFNEMLKSDLQQIETSTHKVGENIRQTFDQVADRLKNQTYDLQLSCPDIKDFVDIPQPNIELKDLISQKPQPYKKSGLTAWFLRLVDLFGQDWGYDNRTDYRVDMKKLQSRFEKGSEQIVERVRKETETLLETFGDEWIGNYIGTAVKRIQEVSGEIIKVIEVAEGDKKLKEKIKQQTTDLHEQHLEIKEDIEMVRGAIQ